MLTEFEDDLIRTLEKVSSEIEEILRESLPPDALGRWTDTALVRGRVYWLISSLVRFLENADGYIEYFMWEESFLKPILEAYYGGKLVDIGAGYGRLLQLYSMFKLEVTAVDPSIAASIMLRRSNIKRVVKGRAENLPFDDSTFDVSVSTWVIHDLSVEQRMKAFKEIKRVTRNGGSIVVIDPEVEGYSMDTVTEALKDLGLKIRRSVRRDDPMKKGRFIFAVEAEA